MENNPVQDRIAQATQLIQRLERISADSVWAHRSSGYRGSLLKWITLAERRLENRQALSQAEAENYDFLLGIGLRMLAGAAREDLQKRRQKR